MVPAFEKFFYPCLLCMKDGNSHSTKELMQFCIDHFQLTEEDCQETLGSGSRTRVQDRVSWSTVYFRHAGMLDNVSRGMYKLNQRGLSVLATAQPDFGKKDLMQFSEFVEFATVKSSGEPRKPKHPSSVPSEERVLCRKLRHFMGNNPFPAEILDHLQEACDILERMAEDKEQEEQRRKEAESKRKRIAELEAELKMLKDESIASEESLSGNDIANMIDNLF